MVHELTAMAQTHAAVQNSNLTMEDLESLGQNATKADVQALAISTFRGEQTAGNAAVAKPALAPK